MTGRLGYMFAVPAAVDVVSEAGVGPKLTLMMHSRPARHIESTTSPLKKSSKRDFSWMNRGCVRKRSEAKCINGLCPGVDFGVCKSVSG